MPLNDITNVRKPGRQLGEVTVKTIISMRRAGLMPTPIAQALDVNVNTVKNILKKANKGQETYKERSGRKAKLSERDLGLLERQIRANPMTSMKRHQQGWNESHEHVSYLTFCKYVQSLGFMSRKVSYRPSIDPKQSEKRLAWCKDKVNWTLDQWKHVIWSDESRYNLIGSDSGARVLRKKGERYHKKHNKGKKKYGGGYVMIWGCFSWAGGFGPFEKMDGMVSQDKYKDFLEKHFLGYVHQLTEDHQKQSIFQEDGATSHTGARAKKWKAAQACINGFDFWPPNSPDLNPIEHVWGCLEKKIEERRHLLTDPKDLYAALKDEWNKLDPGYAETLVRSMPSRCQAVIDSNGEATRY